MDLINPYDRNALKEQAQKATPFPYIAIENLLSPVFAQELADSYPDFKLTADMGKAYSAVNEKLKTQVTNYDYFPEAVKRLCDALKSPKFVSDLEYIFDTPNLVWDPVFAGGGMHQTASRGRLDVHVDFNYLEKFDLHRRLNLLIYLNPDWQDSWGGAVELWDKDVQVCHKSVLPFLNRCVIFETSEISYHGVAAVTCPEHATRKSFAIYYYTKEPPQNWTDAVHSTVFRARPNEPLKKYLLMPAEKYQKKALQTIRAIKSKFKTLLKS